MGGGKQIAGVIVKGLGEGFFFMSMLHYKNEIKKKLGFDAYPGTLNAKITEKEFNELKTNLPIKIEGYKRGSKIFGGAGCRRAKLRNIEGAIIMPDINKHKDILEFIAPVHIKSQLNLKDGDKVELKIFNHWKKNST